MLFETWYFTFLRLTVEGIAIVALGTALVRTRYSFKHILVAGICIGLIGFLLQQLPIQYGVHIPLSIIVFILVMVVFLKLNVLKSAAATIFSFIVLILIEAIMVFIQTQVLSYPRDILEHGTDTEKLLFSLPSLIIFCLIAAGAQAWMRFKSGGGIQRSA